MNEEVCLLIRTWGIALTRSEDPSLNVIIDVQSFKQLLDKPSLMKLSELNQTNISDCKWTMVVSGMTQLCKLESIWVWLPEKDRVALAGWSCEPCTTTSDLAI